MAKRNEDAASEGFQIPIEDASDEAAKAAESNEGKQAQPVGADDEAAPENPVGAQASAPAESGNAPTDGPDAAPDEASDPAEGASDAADDLIAEAEAVVEEAAEGISAADQLEKALADAKEWQDRYMRLHAEWDTYRRRTQEQRAEEKIRATEKLMEGLLPVLDDFERTVAYATENGEAGLLDGVKAVQSKLQDVLTRGGLEVIDPAGEPYDALEAQAVQMVPDEEAFEETVKDVFQKGYKMGKKVLRAAMVTVTTGGPKRPKDDESEEA